jgi:protease I
MRRKTLSGLNVAILAADGFEQVELTVPKKALERAGARVDVISIQAGNIRGMNHMFRGRKVDVNRTLSDADADQYGALLIPGGLIGPDTLRQNEKALQFVRAMDRDGKPIAVICHGPWLLISAGLVRGRRLSSWPGIKDDLENAGAIWEDEPVIRDRNWLSSRGPQDLPQFRTAIVDLFAELGQPVVRYQEDEQRNIAAAAVPVLAGLAALAAVGYGVARARRSSTEAGALAIGSAPSYEGAHRDERIQL